MPTDDAQRLLELVRAELASLELEDTGLATAVERHVVAAVDEVVADGAARGAALTAEAAGRVALAVVEGAVAETTRPAASASTGPSAGPRVGDLSAGQLLRLALGPRRDRTPARG
jgi:hypothetical protein